MQQQNVVYMIDFSYTYKKAFNKLLNPYGFRFHKGFFCKETNRELLLFIRLRKKVISHSHSIIEGCFGSLAYCTDLASINFELLAEEGTDMISIYKRIVPERITPEFYRERINASSDEAVEKSIFLICEDMGSFILPYISKYSDLEFMYSELRAIFKGDVNSYTYGLSLKLHKYKDTILYVENQLTMHSNTIKRKTQDLVELKKGNLSVLWNEPITNDIISIILKKRPDFVKLQIEATEKTIKKSKEEIEKMQIIKKALLKNDYLYLDKIVAENEEKSRKHISDMHLLE